MRNFVNRAFFKGRYIYRGNATDLRITAIKTPSFFRGCRPKARPKSVKTFVVIVGGQKLAAWGSWRNAASEILRKKRSRNLPAKVAQLPFASIPLFYKRLFC